MKRKRENGVIEAQRKDGGKEKHCNYAAKKISILTGHLGSYLFQSYITSCS